jgi:phenylalanyl-tRNA synthetase beta chain
MKIPLSWLKDYVDITIPIAELADRLTFAGMEVEHIEYVGVPGAELVWDRSKIVIAQILEVRAHPNADRLVLADVDYGASEPQQVVTGAPNIFHLKDQGRLTNGPKVVYAREGSVLYDGHQAGKMLMTLKPAKLRGVKSDSMVCSEKELGLSDEHEGIIILDDDAPIGSAAADYLGDVVLDISILPNVARAASILGVAREVAALTGQKLKQPTCELNGTGPSVEAGVKVEIRDQDLCSRFTATIIRGVQQGPSPYWLQRRLRLAGQRPISNIVDVSNYVMFDIGQPIHTFDYDKLMKRLPSPASGRGAGGEGCPTIIVRRAKNGERMTTLDNVDRELNADNLMITDSIGPVGVAGIMGGLETEVDDNTTNVLIEAANFNMINIRQTTQQMKLPSEASTRFGRGIHPAMALRGNIRAVNLIQQLGGGTIDTGVVDVYPQPAETITIDLTLSEVKRILGFEIEVDQIVRILESLEFKSEIRSPQSEISVTVPDHRIDCTGPHDLIEEIARIYGYDRMPRTGINDEMPPQRSNASLEFEERVRDVLVQAGLSEAITYSMTTPQREAKLLPDHRPDDRPYVELANPISAERTHMRHTLLASLLEVAAQNVRHHEHVAMFELNKVYLASEDGPLPDEPRRLSIVMTGPREPLSWKGGDRAPIDFYDLKGVIETLLNGLHVEGKDFEATEHPTYYPGRTARLKVNGTLIGVLGELHPLVRESFDLPDQAVLAAEFDLEALTKQVPMSVQVTDVPRFPTVTEDLALIVDEKISAAKVLETIWQGAGGKGQDSLLKNAELFDVFKGDRIGAGKKSLAYRLTYQADRTLTDPEVVKVREAIIKRLKEEVDAALRG